MNFLELKNYNLEKTLLGGQAFNWDYINGAYYGFTVDKIIKIVPVDEGILWQTYPQQNNIEYIKKLLNLEIDFDTILKSINKDPIIKQAISKVQNIRILKQDFEQTLISFILTAHKNIKAVRKSVRDLSREYGNKVIVDEMEFFTFPSSKVISELRVENIRNIGAGFRSVYILEAAKFLQDNENLELDLSGLSESEARENLKKLNGVGNKVADCVLTFSLGFYSVTPIDIWAQRVAIELYNIEIKANSEAIRAWFNKAFGENTAWAGQFLFEYLRENYKDIKKVLNIK